MAQSRTRTWDLSQISLEPNQDLEPKSRPLKLGFTDSLLWRYQSIYKDDGNEILTARIIPLDQLRLFIVTGNNLNTYLTIPIRKIIKVLAHLIQIIDYAEV
jgi:hypothetical protein